eukprot:6196651-Pleurochrysis_carterae.AAC.6
MAAASRRACGRPRRDCAHSQATARDNARAAAKKGQRPRNQRRRHSRRPANRAQQAHERESGVRARRFSDAQDA